jgi:hypothetical protein
VGFGVRTALRSDGIADFRLDCGPVADRDESSTTRSNALAQRCPYFFKGTTFRELAALIAELDCGVRTSVIERGSHREVIPFIERELARKRLVICSWRAVGESHCHAVLIAGAEGVQKAGRFEPHTFLILDPAEAPPGSMATCNARLHYAGETPGRQRRYASYITASATFSVVLNGAVSLAKAEPQKQP